MSAGIVATNLLGVFLIAVGASHLVVPSYFRTLVPPWHWLPRADVLVLVSGVAEMVIGVGLLLAATRTVAAWAAAGLMAGYVVTHIDALARASRRNRRWLDRPVGAVTRVAVNVVYLVWATTVALWLSVAGP